MKSVHGLDHPIVDYHGKPVPFDENGGQFLVRDALLNIIATSKQPTGRDTMIVHKLGFAMVNAVELEVEDYEHELLKKTVEQSGLYATLVQAQVLLVLEGKPGAGYIN